VTFFATPESERLLLQDVTPLQSGKHTRFLAVHTPYYLVLRKHSQQQVRTFRIVKQTVFTMNPFWKPYSYSGSREVACIELTR
jgi:hypothetical protein